MGTPFARKARQSNNIAGITRHGDGKDHIPFSQSRHAAQDLFRASPFGKVGRPPDVRHQSSGSEPRNEVAHAQPEGMDMMRIQQAACAFLEHLHVQLFRCLQQAGLGGGKRVIRLHFGLLAKFGNGFMHVLQGCNQRSAHLCKTRKASMGGKPVHCRLRRLGLFGNFIRAE